MKSHLKYSLGVVFLFCGLQQNVSCKSYGTASYEAGLVADLKASGVVFEARAPRRPCSCQDGTCGCCSGMLLGQFGINLKQKGCMNLTYDPDEFAFDLKMTMNDKVMYQNSVSGKHPSPVCVPMPRIPSAKFCVKFSNIYFAGRNIHACVDMEGRWRTTTLYSVSFDCFRMGVDGVAIVKPEDGGGLPGPIPGGSEESGEDYEGEGEEAEEEEEEEEEEAGALEDYIDQIEDIASEVVGGDDDDDDEDESNLTINITTGNATSSVPAVPAPLPAAPASLPAPLAPLPAAPANVPAPLPSNEVVKPPSNVSPVAPTRGGGTKVKRKPPVKPISPTTKKPV